MAIILKAHCEDVLRRALLKGVPDYEAVKHAVHEVWPHQSVEGATYVDANGDTQTFTEDSFPGFLCAGKSSSAGTVFELRLASSSSASATEGEGNVASIDTFDTPWQHVEQGAEAGDDEFFTIIDLTDMKVGGEASDPSRDEAGSTRDVSSAGEDSGDLSDTHDRDALAAEAKEDEDTAIPGPDDTQGASPAAPDVSDTQHSETLAPEAEYEDAREAPDDPQGAEAEAHRLFEQRIDIVIAAFDADGDGLLTFKDCAELLKAATGSDTMSADGFDTMCADVGANPEVGLDRDTLMCIYCCGNPWFSLDRDFDAATSKLQGRAPEQDA